jgi:hypothetical protein
MLPAPVTFHSRQGSVYRNHRSLRDVLISRARITNLGLYILLTFAVISLLFNMGYYFSNRSEAYLVSKSPLPHAILGTVAHDAELQALNHLVMVPGHAIWKGTQPGRVLDAENWLLEPYQNTPGRIGAFYNHIAKG